MTLTIPLESIFVIISWTGILTCPREKRNPQV